MRDKGWVSRIGFGASEALGPEAASGSIGSARTCARSAWNCAAFISGTYAGNGLRGTITAMPTRRDLLRHACLAGVGLLAASAFGRAFGDDAAGDAARDQLIAFKGEGVIDAPTLRVASIIVDTSRATEWVESLVEARTLRQISETEYIEYDHVGTPFVMKDRDFVIETIITRMPYEDFEKIFNTFIRWSISAWRSSSFWESRVMRCWLDSS